MLSKIAQKFVKVPSKLLLQQKNYTQFVYSSQRYNSLVYKQQNTFSSKEDIEKEKLKKQQYDQDFFGEDDNQEDKGRKTEADEEDEKLTSKNEKIDYGWQLYRVIFWLSTATLCYHLYCIYEYKDYKKECKTLPYFLEAAEYISQQKTDIYDFFTKPPMKKLLPDIPDIPGFPGPKTLVLNLGGTITHQEYKFGSGTEVLKRPGLTRFLRKLAQMYEIVIFGTDDTQFVFGIAEKLDPTHTILAGRFAKESLTYDQKTKTFIKDLSYLNRDLKRVVVIDKDFKMVNRHQENVIVIPEFKGESEDRGLFELFPLLEHLSRPEVKDVRKEISKYGKENQVQEFLFQLTRQKEILIQKQSQGVSGLFQSKSFGKTTQNPKFQMDEKIKRI